jgi:mannan endo-1,4-beta-mannosidase
LLNCSFYFTDYMKNLFILILLLPLALKAHAQKRSKYHVLDYLHTISGKKTLAGTHNREPNAEPAKWTNKVKEVSGHYPALWSGDFLFQQDNIDNRQIMIDEAVRQWRKGAVINIMWHACNPALSQPCGWKGGVLSKLSNDQWNEIITDGSPLNKVWKQRVDEVCIYLQQLKDKHIEVLWRPMHEMNQPEFWWGGRPGPKGAIKLYQMLHDYFGTLARDVVNYRPDANYWDIAAIDIYDKSGYTDEKYQIMLKAAEGKPIAIGECSKLPEAGLLTKQPMWTFFMGWSELEFQDNSLEAVKAIHLAAGVVVLDKMPGWK